MEAGFALVCAVQMRLQNRTIGCLNMFLRVDGGLSDVGLGFAQAFVAGTANIDDVVSPQRRSR
jgi:hypothetical protein